MNIKQTINALALILSLSAGLPAIGAESTAPASVSNIDDCNVIWDSPSADAKGSMPIGNGDIGLNVWVEPSGDLLFFIGKTDAWDENIRLLKLGKVRVKLTPALSTTSGFRQALKLRDGTIEITTKEAKITVWVDANHPVIHVDARSLIGQPLEASASFEVWRKEKRPFGRAGASWGKEIFATGFTSLPAASYPDNVLAASAGRIGWYHRNVVSPWKASLELQKIEEVAKTQTDPLLNLTMGAILHGDNWAPVSDTELKTLKPAPAVSLRVDVLVKLTDTPEQWVAQLEAQAAANKKMPDEDCLAAHRQWWNAYWNRSWIFVQGNKAADAVTIAYNLQRWMNACGGRGGAPIKFNGSIFVVDNVGKKTFDADFRNWGGPYWFQNTRLVYWPMLTSGDFDQMLPLFDMYLKALPARKVATRNYYGHDGAFFPETLTFFGNYVDEAELGYGKNRTGKPDGLADNRYTRYYWQGGIELIALMLDYYDLTQDAAFRDKTLIPLAKEIITFFDRHWKQGPDGKTIMDPSQSIEAYWDCTNPTPEVAGLHYVLPRLIKLVPSDELRQSWQKALAAVPPIPVDKERNIILGAQRADHPLNKENPQLYPVFPYRLYTVASSKEDLKTGLNTWAKRRPGTRCWCQNAIQAALLGQAKEAQRYVNDNAGNVEPGFRFRAMWAVNNDYVPDQDHGGVLNCALQRMLLQYEGDNIILLPAWPKDWTATFKLHAPKNTTVEGRVEGGKLMDIKVVPESRRKDLDIRDAQ